jgi:hypothetical protein
MDTVLHGPQCDGSFTIWQRCGAAAAPHDQIDGCEPLSGEKQTRGGQQASSAIDPKRTWTASRDSIDLGNGKAAKLGKHLFMIRFFAMPVFLNGASVPYF